MADRFRLAPAAVMLVAVLALAAGAHADAITVQAKPVRLHPFDPSITRVGRLEYRGSLQLSSADTRFGGLSGLLVSTDGDTSRRSRIAATGSRRGSSTTAAAS